MTMTMTITIPPERVVCTYLGANKIKTITLKNYYQEDIQISIYRTSFRTIDSFVYYQGLRLEMENERTFDDFEAAIAESVYQMLLELGLFEKTFKFIEENEPESWDKFIHKCEAFVNENFNIESEFSVEQTYNNFIQNMVGICLCSAYCMLPESEEDTSNFQIWSELFKMYDNIIKYDWDLQNVGEEVILRIPKDNVIKVKQPVFLRLIEKFMNTFKAKRTTWR
ncbi:hypothetical protein [Viridibacillus arvi]|uniref:hypothetical protein n=1 Tax=Viridibacillus arvi TaxID=263475 RepID=UPI0034CE14F7